MKVWFVSAEAAPFFKAGGLGDVAGALPQALEREDGVEMTVFLPLYASLPQMYKEKLTDVGSFTVQVGWRHQYCGLKKVHLAGIDYYFVENDFYFGRPELYSYEDDGERFAFFSQAVIESMNHLQEFPEIIHCNDWHTAVIPVLLKDKYGWVEEYARIKTVLTIHNLQFQGIYDQFVLSDWYGIGYNAFHIQGLEFYDQVNLLKGAIYYSDLITTVSPTYAKEILTPEFGNGLEGALQENAHKLKGILNGLDTELYDPRTNPSLIFHYSKDDLSGKKKNKQALQKKIGLPEKQATLLIGVVTRLTEQKGIQLLQPLFDRLSERDLQLVMLGTGERWMEELIREGSDRYPDQIRSILAFDGTLAQQIYSGADLFLMPSAFEPCGLAQMNAMVYGTLPLVHETGGLADTVQPYNAVTGEGDGFTFYDFLPDVLLETVDRALSVYKEEPDQWRLMMKRAMEKNFTWKKSAKKYLEAYRQIEAR